ncbi:hypothetical protein ACFP81_03745 [Deinococcus lacus]|uniref:Uncharacterized protein n=1 Tax=Deinococcus lacus TaxID=392561 RepID=A0ABW1YB84_9DEIO
MKPGENGAGPLPPRLYSLGTQAGMALLAAALLWPPAQPWAVAWLCGVPVLSAAWVAVAAWRTDRRLSLVAAAALVGLVLVATLVPRLRG